MGEAGGAPGQHDDEKRAIAHVALNRAKATGNTLSFETQKPGQFEPWTSRAAELEGYDPGGADYMATAAIVDKVLNGEDDDPTGGATHFYAPKAQAALGRNAPSWDNGTGSDIGRHRFFKLPYGARRRSRKASSRSRRPRP
jgi:hypothetical protein